MKKVPMVLLVLVIIVVAGVLIYKDDSEYEDLPPLLKPSKKQEKSIPKKDSGTDINKQTRLKNLAAKVVNAFQQYINEKIKAIAAEDLVYLFDYTEYHFYGKEVESNLEELKTADR